MFNRLFGKRQDAPRKPEWEMKGRWCQAPGWNADGAPISEMQFGYYGEIFVKFADGSTTCVWPNGEPVSPYRPTVLKSKPRPQQTTLQQQEQQP